MAKTGVLVRIFDIVADIRPDEFKRKEESSEDEDQVEESEVGRDAASS